jgi:hypothetical protein
MSALELLIRRANGKLNNHEISLIEKSCSFQFQFPPKKNSLNDDVVGGE